MPDAPAPREFRLATVFDSVDPLTGPAFAPGRPRIEDEDERTALAAYLNAGEPLVMTTTLMDDVLDAGRTSVVPMNFRTDGIWIWTDTVTYYLEEHRLAPEPGLLAHLRAAGPYDWAADDATLEAATAYVLVPAGSRPAEPVWEVSGA
ncbi:hypothetical protein [Actinoallomurus iriomotensis]|uniref:Uncharacterized protein n=1 Tax=Actinoallomurus iriomotensis TaxID=478107 RepID=A0A9W6RGS2_9ACTN|nr:hypothetical protein [Actinoallomurus iriomotensis]GLY73787.1 hypothetical protein Airi01_020540 [Actinoallomurus iriomotensis]